MVQIERKFNISSHIVSGNLIILLVIIYKIPFSSTHHNFLNFTSLFKRQRHIDRILSAAGSVPKYLQWPQLCQGQRQELGTQSRSPTKVARIQLFGPSPAAFWDMHWQEVRIGSHSQVSNSGASIWDTKVLTGVLIARSNAHSEYNF